MVQSIMAYRMYRNMFFYRQHSINPSAPLSSSQSIYRYTAPLPNHYSAALLNHYSAPESIIVTIPSTSMNAFRMYRNMFFYRQLVAPKIIYIARYNLSSLQLTRIRHKPPQATQLSMMTLCALSASKARAPMLNSRASKCSQFLSNSILISRLPD